MKLKRKIIGLGIALTVGGGSLAGNFALVKDVRINNRVLTKRQYQIERSNILNKIHTKNNNAFFWTNDGKEWLDATKHDFKDCVKNKNKLENLDVKNLGDSFFEEIADEILLNCKD